METLIIVVLAFYAGWWLNGRLTFLTFKSMMEEAGVKDGDLDKFLDHHGDKLDHTDSEELTEVEITLEQHGEQLYAYRKSDDHFLGQGRDRATLIDGISKNLNNVKLIIHEEDGADLIKNG